MASRPEAAAPEPEFLFALRGDRARGALAEAGTEFDLLFEYRAPSPADLARVRGQALRQAVAANVDIEVAIVPGHLLLVDGTHFKVAKFRNGTLSNEVRFRLRADDPTPNARVHVFLGVNGCVLYDFPLHIEVVARLDSALATGLQHDVRTLNLDEFAKAKDDRQQRHFRLVFNKVGGSIAVTFHEFGRRKADLLLKQIDAGVWSNLLRQTSADVKDIVARGFWSSFTEPLKASTDDAVRAAVRCERNRLISAGSSLYHSLVADGNLAFVFDHIERLQPGSRLSVLSDCGFLPLEILYPHAYHHSQGTEPTASQLWGYRFRIEHLIWDGDASYAYPKEAEQRATPFVSLNLDPAIDRQLTQDASHPPPFLPVAAHGALIDSIGARGWRTEKNCNFNDFTATLGKGHEATLLYYYCHGKSDMPFSADPVAKLAFGAELIDPNWVLTEAPFSHAPVIVLNSCSSGDAGPLSFLTFSDRFRKKGAARVVSTWFGIPILFASAFGRELITRYAASEPIGDVLYNLRRTLLDHDNPLGLFYALQCPMDLRAPATIKQEAA